MIVGICWPTPGPDGMIDDLELLRIVKQSTGTSWLRINLDCRNPKADRLVERVLQAGFQPFPILDGDYDIFKNEPIGRPSPHLHSYLVWAIDLIKRWRFPIVEVLNEPHTMHALSPRVYAKVVNALGYEMRTHAPGTQVLCAAEILQPDRDGAKKYDYEKRWCARLGFCEKRSYWDHLKPWLTHAYYDGVAIHHYRNPGPPSATRFNTREQEHAYVNSKVTPKTIWNTEIGWDFRGGVDELKQAQYLSQELGINQRVGVMGTFIYAHGGPFGITRDRTPLPSAYAIRTWIEQHAI